MAPSPGDRRAGRCFERLKRSFPGPVLRAEPKPDGDASAFKDLPVVAYAGIANPDRFFRLLEAIGARIAHASRFADHHEISESEAELAACDGAAETSATLVTTEKDMARLAGAGGKIGEPRIGRARSRSERHSRIGTQCG